MTLEDVKTYIIKKNLDSKSRKREIADERMYLYGYIFYFLNIDNLSLIGKMFNRDHATVRSALIKVPDIQFQQEFIKNTKELNDQIPIIIPEYKNKVRNVGRIPDVKKRGKEYEITVRVSRDVFYEYARKKDPEVILDYLFRLMLDSAPRLNKSRNPQRKKA
jgi:hypothetical protein